jgi:hypothetical protein
MTALFEETPLMKIESIRWQGSPYESVRSSSLLVNLVRLLAPPNHSFKNQLCPIAYSLLYCRGHWL